MVVEASIWSSPTNHSGSTWGTDLYTKRGSLAGGRQPDLPSAFFRLISDNINQSDGVYIDDLAVTCLTYAGRRSTSTSAQGLRWPRHTLPAWPRSCSRRTRGSRCPDSASALLSTVDAKSSLSGRVATGGRLNAAAALAAVGPPNTTITDGPNGATNDATPTFSFSSSKPGSSFECSVDTADFEPCSGAAQHQLGSHRGLAYLPGARPRRLRSHRSQSSLSARLRSI